MGLFYRQIEKLTVVILYTPETFRIVEKDTEDSVVELTVP